jgi:CxxC motif-containing protein
MGCRLTVDRQQDGSLAVTGNRCPRGIKYANEELLAPKRVVSATATIQDDGAGERALGEVSRLPVRSTAAYPKQDVPELLAAIYALRVRLPVSRGDVLIEDYKGSGVDVIATRTMK